MSSHHPSGARGRRLGLTARALAVMLVGCAAAPRAPLGAQQGCRFGEEGNDVLDRRTVPGGGTITYVSNPHFVCADGVQIWADSAVAYSAQEYSHLMGSVRYEEPGRELRADEARYFSRQERVQAQGNLYVRDVGDGSIIENGELVYLRRADFREDESMTVTTGPDGVRPVARVLPARSDTAAAEAAPPDPYVVVADRIFLEGGARFEATGHVEIERDSLLAFADTATYDRAVDRVVLRGSARVEGPTYDLEGRTIDLLTPDGPTSEVHAVRDAVLTGEDLVIRSSRIRMYLTDGALDRLVATPLPEDSAVTTAGAGHVPEGERAQPPVKAPPGPAKAAPAPPEGEETAALADPFSAGAYAGQPIALVEEFRLTADSIDILAPGERIERVFAGGRARSVSHARDSLNVEELPPIARADWLEGDTVIVYFVPEGGDSAEVAGAEPEALAPADTGETRYRVDRIRALVNARSLYRLAPADSAARAGVDPPAVHYVVGDSITVVMDGDEVERMEVVGRTQGVHLEPLSRRGAPADTVRDTTAVGGAATDTVPPPETGTGSAARLEARRPGTGADTHATWWPPPAPAAPTPPRPTRRRR